MKIIKFLFSPVMMAALFIIFAVSMAAATFIENDFGAAYAYNTVYGSWWFTLLLILLAVNLLGQIIEFKLYRKEKFTVFLFHAAFLVILAGAAITRYFGYEGTIHIRQGQEENKLYSTDKYAGVTVKDEKGNVLLSKMSKYSIMANPGKFHRKFSVSGVDYEVELTQVIQNAEEGITESPAGKPIISIIVSTGHMAMDTYVMKEGDVINSGGYTIGFNSTEKQDVTITCDSSKFFISCAQDYSKMSMMHRDSVAIKAGNVTPIKAMEVFGFKGIRVIPREMSANAVLKPMQADPNQGETGKNALVFHILAGDKPQAITLWDSKNESQATGSAVIDGKTIELFYGSMVTEMPFSLKLNKFILERYPGSTSPSGYKSDVVLIDKKSGTEKGYLIFMNNILKYKGYRFFQSSFDPDEQGTVLSVNHDKEGMMVTYAGYILLFLFIIISIFSKSTIFRNINAGYWTSHLRKALTVAVLLFFGSILPSVKAQELIPNKNAADEFGKVLVQDQKGRTKPLFTLSNDILRKVVHKNEYNGLSSMQVFLGIWLDFQNWQNVKLIKVSNSDLAKTIGISGGYASFSDIVDMKNGGGYKLSEAVQKAYEKSPGERNKFDKEVMKIDERVNIVYMISNGEFMKLFPLKNNSKSWGQPEEALKGAINKEDSVYLKSILTSLASAISDNSVVETKQVAASVIAYQKRFAGYDLPSQGKVATEVFYYKAKIFERLFPFYATAGIILLIALIAAVIKGSNRKSLFVKVLTWLLAAGFLFHTIGLALRWYIAGHSPMSNGYESMIFISWVTLLAGFIFSRKSPFALSATAVLGSMTLMVAHLSFMDPEITNLVPVLKSYLLTIHVSVITGSYGFLGLGAILGLINMILVILSDKKNVNRIASTIDELTVINYQTLTLGLYFLTIGTFLGAVWANESWGRYWGWDPKETWSLITIVIYSIVIHSRMIPGLKDVYSFNLLSVLAFSSVLMTYFGVNYYLSGLHSYAAGDPVPVPTFVYVAVFVLAAVFLVAFFKYDRWRKAQERV